MRMKIIKRFAAGTVGVCFAYALVRQPIAAMNKPAEALAEWTTSVPAVISQTEPETTAPAAYRTETTAPLETQIRQTEPPAEAAAEALTEVPAESAAAEVIEEPAVQEDNNEEEALSGQNDASGDVPTLTQFLSNLQCGGCRHNCLLISPRCMKGRAKAESATVEYYETYGA